MDAQAIGTVSISVVALTQLLKWAALPDHYGPVVVMALSVLGVLFWGWSAGDLSRASAFGYFAGAVVVMTSAAGVYGFAQASVSAVIRIVPPPPPTQDRRAGDKP
jgi:hypothetical protein